MMAWSIPPWPSSTPALGGPLVDDTILSSKSKLLMAQMGSSANEESEKPEDHGKSNDDPDDEGSWWAAGTLVDMSAEASRNRNDMSCAFGSVGA